jgi:glycerol-3-phosphate dehydrogenase
VLGFIVGETKGTSVINSAGIYCGAVRETKGTSFINSAGIYSGAVRETKEHQS